MNIIDVLIILIIGLGAVVGFKRGFFKETVMTVGFVLVFIISYLFKNPVAEILSLKLPFFEFGSAVKSAAVFNIIFYQFIAFILVFFIVMVLFKVLLSISGFIEKVLNFTIILGIPSKILGGNFHGRAYKNSLRRSKKAFWNGCVRFGRRTCKGHSDICHLGFGRELRY